MNKTRIKCHELANKVEAHPGAKALSKISAISTMYDIYFNNLKEFEKHTQMLSSGNGALSLRDRNIAKKQTIEALRLLHNVLAGIKSLVENERWLIRKWYADHAFEEEHKDKVKELFTSTELPKFLEEFRNYFLHQSYPSCSYEIVTESNKIFSRFVINRDDMLSSGWKWSGTSKNFLFNQEEKFEIIVLFKRYQSIVFSFYSWLESRILNIHNEEISDVRIMQKELNIMYRELGYDV